MGLKTVMHLPLRNQNSSQLNCLILLENSEWAVLLLVLQSHMSLCFQLCSRKNSNNYVKVGLAVKELAQGGKKKSVDFTVCSNGLKWAVTFQTSLPSLHTVFAPIVLQEFSSAKSKTNLNNSTVTSFCKTLVVWSLKESVHMLKVWKDGNIQRGEQPARLAALITNPMTSSADTVISTSNTYGEDIACFLLSLLASWSTNSLVKQITNICNGCALHHDLFSSSNKKSA